MSSSIIGIGIISALGKNLSETKKNLFADTPVLPHPPTKIKTSLNLPVFEIPDVPSLPDFPGNYTGQILNMALDEALAQTNLSLDELKKLRVGVAIGTTVACQLNSIPFYATLRKGETPDIKPLLSYINGNPAEYIRHRLGLHGPAITISNACSSGADAIGIGHLWLKQNICDIVIAGGSDELNQIPLDGFNALGVCSPEPCKPFDANRKGLNLGEAAGVVIMTKCPETYSPFSVSGFGKRADAFHITQPKPEGEDLERAIQQALAEAELQPEDIAFINAHGTGTEANDAVESHVFARVFGESIPFMSTKALTGHTLGAAGAIEAIFTLLMLERQLAVKSTRFETKPDDFPVAPLRENRPLHDAHDALSTSLAFGGSNTALVLHYQP